MLNATDTANKANWFRKHWNKYFVVFNPIYTVEGKQYFYSNRYKKTVELVGADHLMDELLEYGAFSIGNGITMALSLVALKLMSELTFFEHMSEIFASHLYLNDADMPAYLVPYLLANRCQVCHHNFKYAFVFNHERVYKYMYGISREDVFLYHLLEGGSPKRYVTTIFNMATRKDQFDFAKPFRYLYSYLPHQSISIYPNLNHLLKTTDFKLIKQILNISECCLRYVLFTIAYNYSKKRSRHWVNLWRYLMSEYWEEWSMAVFSYVNDCVQLDYIPKLPYKLMRDLYHTNWFKYNDQWKRLLKASDANLNTKYMRFFDRKIIHRLKILKQMCQSHNDGHIVENIMKSYLGEHPSFLTL